jgi:hypothetical protein
MVFEWSTFLSIVSKDRTFVHNIVSGPLKDHPISKVSVLSIVSKALETIDKIETFDMGWSLSGPLTILCTNVLSLETIDKTETKF